MQNRTTAFVHSSRDALWAAKEIPRVGKLKRMNRTRSMMNIQDTVKKYEKASHYMYRSKAGIAQFVERPTEKPGAIRTRVRIPGAAKNFSPRANFQCRLLQCPYCRRVQSHASTIARTLKITYFGHRRILHTLKGMGTALLLRRLRLDVCTCSHRAATGLVSVPVSK